MNKEHTPLCDLCLDVVTNECTEEERLAFERHLPSCPACQAEMKELRETWEALSADMKWMSPPEDLKEQVLNAAFAADLPEPGPVQEQAPVPMFHIAGSEQARRRAVRRSRFMTAAAAVMLVLFLASASWNYKMYSEQAAAPMPVEKALNVSASQIKMAVPLHAQSAEYSQAYGFACIVDNGNSKQFVVYVYGAPETAASQAYQVWLIKDGVRTSAGTFRVQTEGNNTRLGVLSMPMKSANLQFDAIGITLEPDDKGSQPRGVKMFSSI
ncbi:hypothetical protein AWM70_14290 [Paenibacillus yonginensis]|uniref:Regulator of SigK n=1 Tax=Paenibacillus yonginensis TaxID=1462996 RepID=A0A1B1N2G8_9BACL|nr:anti-sigma factor [Paenibacillus yonginensis]ANS75620.1 hypothetical protein AWM70_14290 [Paenibacillus yonginensis]